MRLLNNPADPLPPTVLGGLDVDDFLSNHLDTVFDPLVAELGFLSESSCSTQTLAWSLQDPSSVFYREVLDNIFSVPGPALPADELLLVPRVVDQVVTSKCLQASKNATDDIVTVHDVISKVLLVFSCILSIDLLHRLSMCHWWVLRPILTPCLTSVLVMPLP